MVLASQTVEGLWSSNTTQMTVEAIDFDAAPLRDAGRRGAAKGVLCVRFTIVPSTPRRQQNKAKLVAVTLF